MSFMGTITAIFRQIEAETVNETEAKLLVASEANRFADINETLINEGIIA